MEKWEIDNSEKLEISEVSEILFRVFDFTLQPNRKLGFKDLGKKILRFPRFPTFPSFPVQGYLFEFHCSRGLKPCSFKIK